MESCPVVVAGAGLHSSSDSFGQKMFPAMLLARDDLYFEKLGPELAGHKETIGRRVVSDPVEDGAFSGEFAFVDDAGKVDASENLARAGRDAHDFVGLPDVGINLVTDVFKFVQTLDGMPGVVDDVKAADDPKRFRVEKLQIRCAVTQDQIGSV